MREQLKQLLKDTPMNHEANLRHKIHQVESGQQEIVDDAREEDTQEYIPSVKEMADLKRRLAELEDKKPIKLPISNLTPRDGLDEVKDKINHIINYINLGARNA